MTTMSMAPKQLRTKAGNYSLSLYSFVGINIPFVSTTKPSKRPFIGKNNPPVIIQHIVGFSLIELMVTVVVVGILSALAVPSMRTIIQNMRITSQANEFMADLNFARSEAIKRAADVTVCKSADPTAASPTCLTTGTDWGAGRIIFIDSDANGQRVSTEELLRVRETLDGGNTLTNAANLIVYTRTGAKNPATKVDFNLCDTRGAAFGRQISIDLTGRTVLSKPPAGC